MLTNFKLQISSDGSAFDDREAEVARILRKLADNVESGEIPLTHRRTEGKILDINGRPCGRWQT